MRHAPRGYPTAAPRTRDFWVAYGLAALVGILVTAYLMPLDAVLGDGGIWLFPTNDVAETLTGHLAFQVRGWHFPPLLATNLMWPHGASIAMTDSNPLVSLIAKIVADLRGKPWNLLGFWLAACWLLQPVAAVYALRSMGCRSWEAALAASIITPFYPALLFRLVHIDLCGHFLLLIALGQSARMLTRPDPPIARDWLAPILLLLATVLVHPYLFVYAVALLSAPVLRVLLFQPRQAGRPIVEFLIVAIVPAGVYLLMSGTAGSAGGSYGFYSMNLLSPIWPQRSGLFGANREIIDATGGQYEGFNYLGAGVLLLAAAAALTMILQRGFAWKTWLPLVIVLVVLSLHAVSQIVYAGQLQLLYLGWRPWNWAFGFVQSSGRAFWAVGYAVLLAALAALSRRVTPFAFRCLLIVAVTLQMIDTAPMRASARAMLAGAVDQAVPSTIPDGATLLTTFPVCLNGGTAQNSADLLQLAAIRRGMRLGYSRLSRNPSQLDCDRELADGLETPIRPGEVRVFIASLVMPQFRQAALGAGAICRLNNGLITCARHLPPTPGVPSPPGPDLPNVTLPAIDLHGPALAPLLSFGWHEDPNTPPEAASPWATLLFRLPTSETAESLLISLHLQAAARPGSATPQLTVGVAGDLVIPVEFAQNGSGDIDLPVQISAIHDSTVRIVLHITSPIEPVRSGPPGAGQRSGVELLSISVRKTASG